MQPSIPDSARAAASFNTQSRMPGNSSSFFGDPGNAGTCSMPITGLGVANTALKCMSAFCAWITLVLLFRVRQYFFQLGLRFLDRGSLRRLREFRQINIRLLERVTIT